METAIVARAACRYVMVINDRAILVTRAGALTLRLAGSEPMTFTIHHARVGVPFPLMVRENDDVRFEPDYPIIPRKHRAKRSGALKG